MKRTIAVLLCVFIVAFLCSCAQQGTTGQSKPSESNPPQNTESPDSQSTLEQPDESTPEESTSDGSTPEESTSEESTPANEMKLAIDLPDGWEPVEGSNLPAHYTKNVSAVFMVTKQGYSGDTLDTVTELAKSANEKAYGKVQYEGETESIKVDGKDASKFVCTYEFGGLSMKSMFVYFFYGQDTYSIAFSDFAESYDALSDDYAAILAQIKFE